MSMIILEVKDTELGPVAYNSESTDVYLYYKCPECDFQNYAPNHSRSCSQKSPVIRILVPAVIGRLKRAIDENPTGADPIMKWLPVVKKHFPELL